MVDILGAETVQSKFNSFECPVAISSVRAAKRQQTAYGVAAIDRIFADRFKQNLSLLAFFMPWEIFDKDRQHSFSILVIFFFQVVEP